MNRRQFLATASAASITAAMPAPGMAKGGTVLRNVKMYVGEQPVGSYAVFHQMMLDNLSRAMGVPYEKMAATFEVTDIDHDLIERLWGDRHG
jgi:hypothetical protein